MTDLAWDVAGDGPAVVLVPASIGSRRQWDAVVDDLADDFTVVTMDPRGQGESPNPTDDYDDRGDLLEVMAAAGVDHGVLVGCSNGGRVVAEVAALHPGAADGLVLLGPALPGVAWVDAEEDRARLRAADEAVAAGDFDVAVDTYADFFFVGTDRTVQDLPEPLGSRMRSLLMTAVAREQGAWAQGVPLPLDPPLAERLDEVATPTVVAVGAHDHPQVHLAARHYGRHLPDVHVTTLAGVAHFPALEAPALTAELIRDHASMVGARERHAV